jgi:hypothetical protein
MRTGEKARRAPYGHVPFTYTFGEMFQTIEVLRGEREVPEEIRQLCFMDSEFIPVPRAADFNDVDVFLIEPASPVDMIYRDCYLNRIPLSNIVLQPLRALGKEAAKYANLWLRCELTAQDDEKRLELADALIDLMPDDLENGDFIRSVLSEAYARKIDVPEAFRKLQNLVGRPLGVVNYIFRYMEDGRAVSWPAGLQEEIQSAARSLGLPVFDPVPVVCEYGVKEALLPPDFSHYTEQFDAVIGDRLTDFAKEILENADVKSDSGSMPEALGELSAAGG